jgi:hypothetical protein
VPAPRFPAACLLLFSSAFAAAGGQEPQQPPQQPPIRVTILQVCTPAEEDAAEMAAALARIPETARFSPDFEVARGRSSEPEPASRWVRIRRDFAAGAAFRSVQYSFRLDEQEMTQTLVFYPRDTKDVLQVAIESTLAAGAGSPPAVLAQDRPAGHVKLERFGRSSVALRRCPGVDQKAYAAIFDQASLVLARYSAALGVRGAVPQELERAAAPPRPTRPPSVVRRPPGADKP